ncbi:MAG: peptidoglycan-binding domain-containing protein [Pseudomonadota bacterium]
MRRFMIAGLATVALTLTMAISTTTPTLAAKECKADPITASGRPFVSRTLGAFPSSLFAWRRAARDEAGRKWNAWRHAADRKIDCEQKVMDTGKKRWVCTRTARPCNGGGVELARRGDDDYDDRPNTDFGITDTLRKGSKGKQVRILQEILIGAGFRVKVDGDFGNQTLRAVKKMQREFGLRPDGVVGPRTIAAMIGAEGATS